MSRLHAHLQAEEGYRRHPYVCTAGTLTIGFGRNLESGGISPVEADYLLANDITRVEAELDRYLPWWRAVEPEARRCALVAMGFQLGIHGLLRFRKTLDFASRGLWGQAAAEALESNWARQTPKRALRVADMLRTGRWSEEL